MQEANTHNIFFTSDNHFGHETAVARPAKKSWGTNTRHQFCSVEAMDQGMADAWNLQVPEDGTVYILGDFAYNGEGAQKTAWTQQKTRRMLGLLHGTKHLIVGNHDLGFKNQQLCEELYQESGFASVTNGTLQLELGGRMLDLCHFPRWQGPQQKPDHYPAPIEDWNSTNWLLHGHSHGQIQLNAAQKMVEIGVDAWSFRPVVATTILGMIDAAERFTDIQNVGITAPNTYTV